MASIRKCQPAPQYVLNLSWEELKHIARVLGDQGDCDMDRLDLSHAINDPLFHTLTNMVDAEEGN